MKPRTALIISVIGLSIFALLFTFDRSAAKAAAFRNGPDRVACEAYWYNRVLTWFHQENVCDPSVRERYRVMADMTPPDHKIPDLP